VLVIGLLLAYAHNQLQEVALRTTLEVVRSMFRVELDAPTVSASLFRGEVVLRPLRAGVEGETVLQADELQVRVAMDWTSFQPRLQELVFRRPDLRLHRRADGTWNLGQIFDTEALTHRPEGERGYRQDDVPPLRIEDGSIHLTGPNVRGALYMDDIDLVLRHAGGDTLESEGQAWVRRTKERPEVPRNHLRFTGRLQADDKGEGRATAHLEQGELDLLEAFLGSDLQDADGDFEATVTLEGPLSSFDIDLDAQIELSELRTPLGAAGTLNVPELNVLLTVRPEQPTRALVDARRFSFRTPDGCTFPARALDGRMRLHPEGFEFEEANFRWGQGRVHVQGDTSLTEGLRTHLDFSGENLEAEPLSCLIHDEALDLTGTFSVPAGSWEETTSSRDLALEIAAADLTATLRRGDHQAALELRSITGRLHATTSVVELVDLEASRDSTRLVVDGPLWSADGSGLTLDVEVADLPLSVPVALASRDWSGSTGVLGGKAKVRAHRGELRVQGAVRIPIGELRGPAEHRIPLEKLAGSFALRAAGGILHELDLVDVRGVVLGSATTATLRHGAESQELSLETEAAPLPRILALADIPGLEKITTRGDVGVELRARRDGDSRSLEGRLRAKELPLRPAGLGATTLEELSLAFAYAESKEDGRSLVLEESTARAFGGEIRVSGSVQEDASGPGLALELAGKALDTQRISDLLARKEGRFDGIADISGSLEGPLETPRLRARVVWEKPTLVANLGEKPVRLFPDRLDGAVNLTPGKVQVGPLRGQVGGGPFSVEFDLDLLEEARPWRLKFGAKDVDAARLVEPYLTDIEHDVFGQLEFSALLHGKGADATKVAAGGSFGLSGGIRKLSPLVEAEKKYKLQNLHDIGIEKCQATLGAAMGTLNFRDIEVKTTHGSARGEVGIGLDGALSGEVRVALDRMVLSGGHRLLSQLEGGNYFNFRLHPGGTLAEPDYGFRTRAGAGALVTGAVLFSPVAAPAAIFMGLKNLFGGKRRPRRLEPKPLPDATPAPSPSPSGP
jgi:hypothetical protein